MSTLPIPVTIRQCTPADNRRVAEITLESIDHHATLYEHVRPAPELLELAASFSDLAAQPDHYVTVAELDGHVVGFLTAVLRPAPTGGIERFDGQYVFVADVAVASEARGRGIGRSLMDDVATWARGRGACALTLSVHTQNPASHLYRDLGYQGTWQTYRKDL